ncbi:MAG: hypothetical protein SGCHY_003641 [Lobulomycetales sp.]
MLVYWTLLCTLACAAPVRILSTAGIVGAGALTLGVGSTAHAFAPIGSSGTAAIRNFATQIAQTASELGEGDANDAYWDDALCQAIRHHYGQLGGNPDLEPISFRDFELSTLALMEMGLVDNLFSGNAEADDKWRQGVGKKFSVDAAKRRRQNLLKCSSTK